MFLKLGEAVAIDKLESAESSIPLISPEILENFRKTAAAIKKIAPKADDFLYFSAVMMHAAEAASLHDDGTQRLTSSGSPVTVGWDSSNGTLRWKTNDKSIKPYKNCNGDIFPESELVKAHKKWVGKPLCIDHKSSSVDHVRGFIVDTYYDRKQMRVIALCALDKINYPDLARKVSTGYSNNVSMGTAVGRAICFDCRTVARTEHDFCDHMKRKSGYGEINADLNPIELSIVVNGADPAAKIKDIFAMAQNLNNYVERKGEELRKIAEKTFSANFSFTESTDPQSTGSGGNISVSSKDLDTFKKDVEEALSKLSDISSSIEEESGKAKELSDAANIDFNQSNDSDNEIEMPSTDQSIASPSQKMATDQTLNELHTLTEHLEAKLSDMKKTLTKLAANTTKEDNMSGKEEMNKKGYYQGTVEPTPGQSQYSKDPLNEKLRMEDKHMVGQMDTGPVDGMHPGPDSTSMSELERKKMLARAEAEGRADRAMKRTAFAEAAKKAMENKTAWFQNGDTKENPGTPTPGKVKYPADKLNEEARKNDKHMNGQKPFPSVGAVDGLHPSPESADEKDELKRKEKLSRASLNARFVDAINSDGTRNLAKSAWEVYLGDKLLLTASVNDFAPGRAGMMFDTVKTREFGAQLIGKIKAQGADKVNALIKSAQGAPAPAAPPVAPEMDLSPEPAAADNGGTGDAKETALELSEKVRDLSSDLVESVRALTGEKAEMGEDTGLGVAASFSTQALQSMRKEINSSLTSAMKQAIATLNDHAEELDVIHSMYDRGAISPANSDTVDSVVQDSFEEAKTAVADGFKLMTAFVKYARGTKAMVKRAQMESDLESLTHDENQGDSMSGHDDGEDLLSLLRENDEDLKDLSSDVDADESFEEESDPLVGDLDLDSADDEDMEDDLDADTGMVQVKTPQEAAEVSQKNPSAHVSLASLETKAARAEMRRKLASESVKFSPMLDQAHPKGGFTTQLDVKPSGDLALVEDLEEKHSKMLQLAEAPVKIRKEAAEIQRLISNGSLQESDLDALVAEGLDKDAVSYWKKFYGQVDGGSEFASELVKEHAKAAQEERIGAERIKLARAFELTYEMVDRGLCHNDRTSINAQVNDIVGFSDEAFDSLKRVVAKATPAFKKQAGLMPQVGIIGSGDVGYGNSDDNLQSQLTAAFAGSKKSKGVI